MAVLEGGDAGVGGVLEGQGQLGPVGVLLGEVLVLGVVLGGGRGAAEGQQGQGPLEDVEGHAGGEVAEALGEAGEDDHGGEDDEEGDEARQQHEPG